MPLPFADHSPNFAESLVATAPSPATTGTTIIVTGGEGVKFPTPPFRAVVWLATEQPDSANSEIVEVTKIATDTLTVTRNVNLATLPNVDPDEQGSARTIVVGDKIAAVITAYTFRRVETPLEHTVKYGSMTIVGQSLTAGATQQDVGTANPRQESLVSKLSAMLGIHESNTLHLGIAGSRIAGNGIERTALPFSGWPGVYQFVWPNNSAVINAATDSVFSDPVVAVGGVSIIVHGANDFLDGFDNVAADDAVRLVHNTRAAKHAYRAIISRLRAGVVYAMTTVAGTLTPDATITERAGWTTSANIDRNSGSGFLSSADFATPESMTVTIPSNFRGGTVAFSFLGGVAGVSNVSEPLDASETGVDVTSRSSFPASGTFVVKVDSEKMLVTAGWGTGAGTFTVTRGVGGTSAATHSTGAVIQTDDNNFGVVVSGTVFSAGSNPSHPNIILSGQGSNNFQCPVVTRYALTSADAGKTIVFTLTGVVTNDSAALVVFDSWWIEASEPPPCVVTNIQHWEYGHKPFSTYLNIAFFNAMIDAVVAEFDSWVRVADIYTRFWKRNGELTSDVDAAATSIGFTSNDESYTPQVGTQITFGRQSGERMLITAVSGSHPTWTLTVTRGFDGTTPLNPVAGDRILSMDWMYKDQLHLNVLGHAVYAETIFQEFNNMPSPSEYQVAQSVGNWSQYTQNWGMGIIDNALLYSNASAMTTLGMTQSTQYAVPVWIPRHAIIVGIGVSCTADAAATLRYGIYLPDNTLARPGRLLQEFGTIAGAGIDANDGAAELTLCYQVVRSGWYWLSVVSQGAGATVRATTPLGGGTFPSMMSTTALGAASVNGYTKTGITGALADWGTVLTQNSGSHPRMFVRLRAVTV